MGNKNDYLPTCYWIEENSLHRAFYNYSEDVWDSPRDWDNLGTIVNFSGYSIAGDSDITAKDSEDWLLSKTGINSDWYYSHQDYGIDGLLKKFTKQCAAFLFLSIYDHSGISIHCGKNYGWDWSNIGFIYIPKDNKEFLDKVAEIGLKKAKEWAEKVLRSEIQILDDYLQGSVFTLVKETYNTEFKEWEQVDILEDVYLTSDSWEEEKKLAEDVIKGNFSGNAEFITENIALNAIYHKELDILLGQNVFNFEIA